MSRFAKNVAVGGGALIRSRHDKVLIYSKSGMHRSSNWRGLAQQFQSAKQLRVCSHDDGRTAHRCCAHTHGEIKSPAHEETCRDWNGDQVIFLR